MLVVAGYFFWYKPKYGQAPAPIAAPIEVSAIKLQKQKVSLLLELPARVTSYKISEVRPRVDGIIRSRKFVEGSFVKEGQQLYQIDSVTHQANFYDANANFKAIRAKRDRYKNLLEEDAISKQEFDDITAVYAKAEADLKKAATNLSYTRVLAPISGYIGKSNVAEGMLVNANQAGILTTITQLDPIYVDMVQPSKDALRIGDQAEISVNLVIDDVEYKEIGRLKFTEKFVDEGTDSVRLRAVFSNKDEKLLPGMFVSAKLHLKPIEAIIVPQKATSRGPDGNLTIWVVAEGNIAKSRVIKADQVLGDMWIIKEGLEEGDVIIVEGFLKLADGAKIQPNIAEQKVGEQEPELEEAEEVSKPVVKAKKRHIKAKIKKKKNKHV